MVHCRASLLFTILLLPSVAPVDGDESRAAVRTEAFVIHLKAIEESKVEGVRKCLARIGGVDKVEMDTEDSTASLTMKMRTLLDESAVKSALDVLGIEVEAFDYPKWAKVTIYTARVASWGR